MCKSYVHFVDVNPTYYPRFIGLFFKIEIVIGILFIANTFKRYTKISIEWTERIKCSLISLACCLFFISKILIRHLQTVLNNHTFLQYV